MIEFRRAMLLFVSLAIFLAPFGARAESGFSDDPDRVEIATKSVLMLEVYDGNGIFLGSGSGFVAFDSATLVTNYHVIEGADMVVAYTDEGDQYIVDQVIAADKKRDLAILVFSSPTDLVPLSLNVSGELKRAQKVVAIGSPIGITNTVSIGNISALYEEDGVSEIQFTAPISPGSSGGALFDDNGEVIGITSATYLDAQNINIAVNAREVFAMYAAWDGADGQTLSNAAPTPSPTPGTTVRPMPKPTQDPNPTALPKTYTELKYGDKGDAVKELQLALIRLGYLDGETDGIFGKNTRQAVYDFNLANGLISGNLDVASNKTLQLLYDGNPVSFQEPAMALYFEDSAYAEWYDLSGDEIQIHFQVTNKAKHKTVKAFELYAYATDVWGTRIYGTTAVYYWTTTKNVKPGATIYSDYVTMPDRSEINLIYCGISRIIYADGSVEALEDDEINYFSWSITD